MNIVQISTYDSTGGAAKAAYRLHRGLREMGENSLMLVKHKSSSDTTILQMAEHFSRETAAMDFYCGTVIQKNYINSHRTDISNTFFSLPYPGMDLERHPAIQAADIINLHWIAYYQSPESLRKILSLGKPVVWTLHDQWPFTGGCHYSAGCLKYVNECSSCPQLSEDPFGLSAAILKDRKNVFQDTPLTLVSPSRWMAHCARESLIFRKARIETIPNSIDTGKYSPMPKDLARKNLGMDPEGIVLLFGSENMAERRKGLSELLQSLHFCMASAQWGGVSSKGKIRVLCYGNPPPELQSSGIPIIPLGFLRDEEQLRFVYCAADIFLLPSLEDNLPNTILESLSCGTPVIAFDTGGIRDIVIDGRTGFTLPLGNHRAFGEAIAALCINQKQRESLGQNARALMAEQFALANQARDYAALYQDVIKTPTSTADHCVGPAHNSQASENGLGVHMQQIYDQVLYRSLKEYALQMQQNEYRNSEERKAHVQALDDLTVVLKTAGEERQAQVQALDDLTVALKTADEERKAHVQALADLTVALKTAGEERKAHVQALDDLTAGLKTAGEERKAHVQALADLTVALKTAGEERNAHLHAIEKLTTHNKNLLAVLARRPIQMILHLFRISLPSLTQETDVPLCENNSVSGNRNV